LWQTTTIAAGSKATTKAKSAIPIKEPFELEKELLEKPKKKAELGRKEVGEREEKLKEA
jgi:hypothetical protein